MLHERVGRLNRGALCGCVGGAGGVLVEGVWLRGRWCSVVVEGRILFG